MPILYMREENKMINIGIKNELIYVNYLNNKKVSELNPLIQELLYKVFNKINDNNTVTARKSDLAEKTDIIVTINEEERNFSLKIGDKNSFHMEPISEFIHFLIENGFEKEVIEKYLKFHYADGTTNGTGTRRMSVSEYKEHYQKDIDYLNEKFKNKEFINKCIERFILKGRIKNSREVDAVISGKVNDLLFITNKEVKYLVNKYIDIKTTGLHIGPLFIQPHTRNLNYNKKYEKYRYCVQIKWFNFTDHIIWYMNELVIKNQNM